MYCHKLTYFPLMAAALCFHKGFVLLASGDQAPPTPWPVGFRSRSLTKHPCKRPRCPGRGPLPRPRRHSRRLRVLRFLAAPAGPLPTPTRFRTGCPNLRFPLLAGPSGRV